MKGTGLTRTARAWSGSVLLVATELGLTDTRVLGFGRWQMVNDLSSLMSFGLWQARHRGRRCCDDRDRPQLAAGAPGRRL